MSTKPCVKNQHAQQGVSLLEAIISIVLSSFVVLGATYSVGRMVVSQQQNNLQYIVINQLRLMQQQATTAEKNAWCNKSNIPQLKLPQHDSAVEIKVTCKPIEITIENALNPSYNQTLTDMQPVKFEIEHDLLGGKMTLGEELK